MAAGSELALWKSVRPVLRVCPPELLRQPLLPEALAADLKPRLEWQEGRCPPIPQGVNRPWQASQVAPVLEMAFY